MSVERPCIPAVEPSDRPLFCLQEIERHTGQHNRTRPFSISSFSMASLNSILRHFADLDLTRVGIGYGLMVRAHLVMAAVGMRAL